MKINLAWGDLATWVTGLATIALFVIGFLQIRNERNSRIRSELQLEISKRRDQSEKVSSWIVGENQDGLWITVLNQSQQPVYQMVISIMILGQSGDLVLDQPVGQTFISVVPPGKGYALVYYEGRGMGIRPGIEISFKDVTGRNWVRKTEGDLIQIGESIFEYYHVMLPVTWMELLPELPTPQLG